MRGYIIFKGEIVTLTLAATTNQTITLKYTEPGMEEKTITSGSTAKTISVETGTTWRASIVPASNYTAGILSPGTSGTISRNTTITATASTLTEYRTLTVTTVHSEHNPWVKVKYTNTSGNVVTTSRLANSSTATYQVKYNTQITIISDEESSYDCDRIQEGNTTKAKIGRNNNDGGYPTSWTSPAITADTAYTVYGFYDYGNCDC